MGDFAYQVCFLIHTLQLIGNVVQADLVVQIHGEQAGVLPHAVPRVPDGPVPLSPASPLYCVQ